jgi:hypothetical protein
MGEEGCLHVALRSRHDLRAAIGWREAWKRVVNGVDCVIIVLSIRGIDVGVDNNLTRKATRHEKGFTAAAAAERC